MWSERWRRPRAEEDREDVLSTETWDGGAGVISFNHLQQRPVDTSEGPETPLEAAGTTDTWGITDG